MYPPNQKIKVNSTIDSCFILPIIVFKSIHILNHLPNYVKINFCRIYYDFYRSKRIITAQWTNRTMCPKL